MSRQAVLVAPHFAPENAAGTYRSLYLARALEDAGFGVRVVTRSLSSLTSPDPSLSEVFPDRDRVLRVAPGETLNDRYRRLRRWGGSHGDDESGGDARPAPPGAGSPNSHDVGTSYGVRTLLGEALVFPDAFEGWVGPALRQATPWLAAHPPDLVFASGPPFSAFRAARRIAERFGSRIAVDFRDPWSTATGDFRHYEHPFWRLMARRLEEHAVARADVVTFNSPGLARRAANEMPRFADRFHTVLNGTEAPLNEDRRSIPPDEPLRFSHIGSLYAGRHLRSVASGLDAALRTRDGSGAVAVTQVGPRCAPDLLGVDEVSVEALTIEQTGPISRRAALERAAVPGVLVVVQMEKGAMQIPSKFFDYLATGNPVLVVARASSALWEMARTYPRCHRIDLEATPRNAEVLGALLDRWRRGELAVERATEDAAHLTRTATNARLVETLAGTLALT